MEFARDAITSYTVILHIPLLNRTLDKQFRHTVVTGSRYCCYTPVLHWFGVVIGSIVVQDW